MSPARLARTAALFAGFVLAGAALCAFVTWLLVLDLSRDRLSTVARGVLSHFAAMDREARLSIDTFNRQPDAFCSDAELEKLREEVFRTRYVKDVGRLRAGRFVCSGALQRLAPPREVAKPDIETADGLSVYASEPLLLARNSRAPILQAGETNAVLDPDGLADEVLLGADYVAGYIGKDGRFMRLYGRSVPLESVAILAGRPVDRGGTLFQPLCNATQSLCVTATLDKASIRATNWPLLAAGSLLGGLLGLVAAMLVETARRRTRTLPSRLRRALGDGRLDVLYQPVVALPERRVVGCEALVRWLDDTGQFVPPSVFIPIAEARGWVSDITELVMRRAVVDLAPLLSEQPGFHVNVNISVRDLRSPSFFAIVDDLCAEAGLSASSIAFEVTEHATADRDATVSGLRLLRDRGHRIYLDDFGTGYSSLSYLGDLPVDALKIDRGFTETFDHDSSKSAVLVQILELARQLDLDIVAEGVETERQAQWFQDRGVTRAQGWLFGRPMSAETFLGFVSP